MLYTYKALVTDKETKEVKFLESDYPRKEDFRKDLVRNGYSVKRVELKDLYDFMLENAEGYEWEWETARKLYWKKNLTVESFREALER